MTTQEKILNYVKVLFQNIYTEEELADMKNNFIALLEEHKEEVQGEKYFEGWAECEIAMQRKAEENGYQVIL